MRVVLVYEENHGLVAVAKSYVSAVQFLVDDGWLNERLGVEEGQTVFSLLGENWLEKIKSWNSFARFTNFFEGYFSLSGTSVVE